MLSRVSTYIFHNIKLPTQSLKSKIYIPPVRVQKWHWRLQRLKIQMETSTRKFYEIQHYIRRLPNLTIFFINFFDNYVCDVTENLLTESVSQASLFSGLSSLSKTKTNRTIFIFGANHSLGSLIPFSRIL